MTIDWQRETTMTLKQAADALNRSVQQIHAWVNVGLKVNGRRVRLEAIRIGTLHTSAEALQRFCEAIAPAQDQVPGRIAAEARRWIEEHCRPSRNRRAEPEPPG